jgi:hypothetical protein
MGLSLLAGWCFYSVSPYGIGYSCAGLTEALASRKAPLYARYFRGGLQRIQTKADKDKNFDL